MNHFFALIPDADTCERLNQVSQRLQAWQLPARWVIPADLHCTLWFAGSLTDQEADLLGWAADDWASSFTTQPCILSGLGAFAGKQRPRVTYAALTPDDWIRAAHHDFCAAIDVAPKARFHPHITLARPSPGSQPHEDPLRWRDLFEAFGQAHWGTALFDQLALMVSDPVGPQGPFYRCLRSWDLSYSPSEPPSDDRG
jgi:2'-5' RNA ligase